MPPAKRFTQLQRDVLSLYRRGLRAIRTKPVENRPNFTMYLRYAFAHPDQGGGIRQRDFQAVEYMMRRADRMMEQILEDPSAKDMSITDQVVAWYNQQNHPRTPPTPSPATENPTTTVPRDAPRATRTSLKKKTG